MWYTAGAPAGVPSWAFRQLEDLKLAQRFVDWWIDERQVPYGDFGGGAEGAESGGGVMKDGAGVDGVRADGAYRIGDEGGDFEGFLTEWMLVGGEVFPAHGAYSGLGVDAFGTEDFVELRRDNC